MNNNSFKCEKCNILCIFNSCEYEHKMGQYCEDCALNYPFGYYCEECTNIMFIEDEKQYNEHIRKVEHLKSAEKEGSISKRNK